jgi:hypothetical protein
MDKSVKESVADLLRKRDYARLLDLCEEDRGYWQAVRSHLYDLEERIRWASVETVSKLMQLWWESGKEEKVRQYVRTLFWSISDESGGIGWSSPQVIAEIIAHIPALIDPYGSMMIAYSIEEPPLIKGCLWGIGRLGRSIVEVVDSFREKILAVFGMDDAEILGLASWAMGQVGFYPAIPFIEKLSSRSEPVVIYVDCDFIKKPLGHWVEEAIHKIKSIGAQNFFAPRRP